MEKKKVFLSVSGFNAYGQQRVTDRLQSMRRHDRLLFRREAFRAEPERKRGTLSLFCGVFPQFCGECKRKNHKDTVGFMKKSAGRKPTGRRAPKPETGDCPARRVSGAHSVPSCFRVKTQLEKHLEDSNQLLSPSRCAPGRLLLGAQASSRGQTQLSEHLRHLLRLSRQSLLNPSPFFPAVHRFLSRTLFLLRMRSARNFSSDNRSALETCSKTCPANKASNAAHARGPRCVSPRHGKGGRVCLLVVDAQYDFCEGALAAPQGVRIAERIGRMLEQLRRLDNGSRRVCSSRPPRNGATAASCEELTTNALVRSVSLGREIQHSSSSREGAAPGGPQGGEGGAWCDLVVFSLDWHPPDHVSFEASHTPECLHRVCCCGGRGEAVSPEAQGTGTAAVESALRSLGLERKWTVVVTQLEGQAPHAHVVCLWPTHCVQGSKGAKLHPAVKPQIGDYVVRKATLSSEECFSACGTACQPTGLVPLLQAEGVQTVAICVPLRAAGIPHVVVLTDFTAAIHEEKQRQTVLYLDAHQVRCMPYQQFVEEQEEGGSHASPGAAGELVYLQLHFTSSPLSSSSRSSSCC
ncbi:hypothetical protein Esti_003465 [Eimeria stiedai]